MCHGSVTDDSRRASFVDVPPRRAVTASVNACSHASSAEIVCASRRARLPLHLDRPEREHRRQGHGEQPAEVV